MKTVAVGIAVYNSSKYLKECLNSVINQTYSALEIIIVNDGSTTNAEEEIISSYIQKDSRIKYIKHTKNKGLYKTRETIINSTTSPYVLFLDSDDFLPLSAVELLFQEVKGNKLLDVVSGAFTKLHDNQKEYTTRGFINKDDISINFGWYIWGRLFKTSVISNIYQDLHEYTKDYHITLSEDFLFMSALYIKNFKYKNIDKNVYYYRINTSSTMYRLNEFINNLSIQINYKDFYTIETILISQINILNIILKYLQKYYSVNLINELYKEYINTFFIQFYLYFLAQYYQFIIESSNSDKITPLLNTQTLLAIIKYNTQNNTKLSQKQNFIYRYIKKFERNVKLYIYNRLFHFYKNKYYKISLQKSFTAWEQLKTNTPITIKSWGISLYEGKHGLFKYLVKEQNVQIYLKRKHLKTAKTLLIHGYSVNSKTLKMFYTAGEKGIIPIYLEDGFIRSVANVHNKSMPHVLKQAVSYTLDDYALHFDANKISRLEQKLNSDNKLNQQDLLRASKNIKNIVSNNISKYNDYSQKPDPAKLGDKKQKVLVIDQAYNDCSILYGKINQKHFNNMVKCAIKENPNADIIIKQHPDMIHNPRRGAKNTYNKRAGYISHLTEKDGIIPIKQSDINPLQLIKMVDKVYVCSSLMGLEALICGKEVVTFGIPFYSGWGLTEDRHQFFNSTEGKKRRNKIRTLEEIFYYSYIWYSRYISPLEKKECELETAIDNIIQLKDEYIKIQ